MINNDHRSPNRSSEMLTGHPERGVGFGFAGTAGYDNKSDLRNASDRQEMVRVEVVAPTVCNLCN